MSLSCPTCSVEALDIFDSIELPPDASSDEITLQIVECKECGWRGIALYAESRRGSEPAWFHTVYSVDDEELDRLALLISSCPRPRFHSCRCEAHGTLGAQDANGAWSPEEAVRLALE